jgi:hypothetical protein
MSKLGVLYLLVGLGGLGGYGYISQTGWEYGTPHEQFVPRQILRSPGGYRSFHYWHIGYGGYRGGK